MKNRFVMIIGCLLLAITHSYAQSKFKAGLGVNYISNTYDQPHQYDYFAPSANLSYTLFQRSIFGISIENATSLRINGVEAEKDYKFGFTSSFPLLINARVNKINIYTGTGPSYVKQVSKTNVYYEKASGYYLNNIFGVGFKGKSAFADAIYPEYNIRLSYLKSLSHSSPDGGIISFIVFLKS